MKKMFISVIALAMSVMAMATETAYVQIKLTGESGGASNVFLTEDDAYTNAFEPGADVEKMMSQSNSKSVLMYGFVGTTPCEDVVAANLDGLELGFSTNQVDQNYTLSFIDYEGSKTLTLYDLVTGDQTVITDGGSYNFSVEAAQVGRVQINNRFVINYTCSTVRSGLNVDQYYTICLPKAVTSANGASFWNMSNRGDGVAYLVEAELPLVAGRPYIIQAEATELCVVYSGEDAVAGTYGALHGTFAAMDQAALDLAGSDIYLLKNNELWLVSGQTGNSLAANRAYIVYSDLILATPQSAPGRRVRAIPMQNQGTTGVENLNASEAPVKTVIDGTMYIIRGEHMFDATGRMVK